MPSAAGGTESGVFRPLGGKLFVERVRAFAIAGTRRRVMKPFSSCNPFLRSERSNQFENKQLPKISSLSRRCSYRWKRKKPKEKSAVKIHLLVVVSKHSRKKWCRGSILGPGACVWTPWDYVICFLNCPLRDRLLCAFKSGSKHK